jgi:hypothetical protein
MDKSMPSAANATERSRLKDTLAPLYRGQKSYSEMDARGEVLGRLTEAQQLMILDDRELGTMADSKGLTPVHDLARYGSPTAQNRILDKAKEFEGPEFRSELGAPLDILAMNGNVDVQLRMVKLPIEELTAIRTIRTLQGTLGRQTTLLHELASDSYNAPVISKILELPKDVLMLRINPDDDDSESVLQVIVSGGGSKAARDLAKTL